MQTIYDRELADSLSNGTFKSGLLTGVTYNQLVDILGEPTYNEESGDGKVQVEWVVLHDDKAYTIYDWKTFDREYTLTDNILWNVGSKGSTSEFIDEIVNSVGI